LAEAKSVDIERRILIPVYTEERGLVKDRKHDLCDYNIKIINDSGEKKEIVFENITFIVNKNLNG
jgi:hypothetical protein